MIYIFFFLEYIYNVKCFIKLLVLIENKGILSKGD